MTNSEKYKTAQERAEAFRKWCRQTSCDKCKLVGNHPCILEWLDLEYEAERPLPCPFCGTNNNIMRETNGAEGWIVRCYTCGYRSMVGNTEDAAIEAHNRVARAVKEAKEAAK